ncbi:MAG: hypothetical protein VX546_09795 [Myxococcota bacterium]|nr:hypothetical protein [Myxococcota bacterium]
MNAIPIGIAFLLLAAWSWGRWTDPQIDFGNELYVAWRLSEGESLYGDIAHRNGPLSHYWNALLFRIFGVSLRTLVWANLAVLAAICALAHAVLRRAVDPRTATICVLVLLGIFGFSQYGDVANYNYVTPYHHFQTHGIALGLGLLLALLRALESGSRAALATAGLCLGALMLTKLELWLPAAAAAGIGLVLVLRVHREAARQGLPAFVLGILCVPGLFLALLASAMPFELAWRGLFGNLAHLGPALWGDAFYRAGAGLDAPGRNLLRIGFVSLGLAGVALALVAADRELERRAAPAGLRLFATLLVFAVAITVPAPAAWFATAAALPVVALAVCATTATAIAREPSRSPDALRRATLLLWSIWSLGLLAKLFLLPRFQHYGFALAMPASLLLVAVLVGLLPGLARRAGGSGNFARAAATALCAAAVLGGLRVSAERYAGKSLWVGPPGDTIRVESAERAPRGTRMGALSDRLAEVLPPDSTLLVYPEGAMLNYWTRRDNPSRFLLYLPTELDAAGRETVRADVAHAAPDFVVMVQRGHGEFGVGPFGQDPRNGQALVAWIRANYELVERLGPEPFTRRGFGAEIWQRTEGAGP